MWMPNIDIYVDVKRHICGYQMPNIDIFVDDKRHICGYQIDMYMDAKISFISQSIYLSIYHLPIDLSISPSRYLSFYVSIYVSIYTHMDPKYKFSKILTAAPSPACPDPISVSCIFGTCWRIVCVFMCVCVRVDVYVRMCLSACLFVSVCVYV